MRNNQITITIDRYNEQAEDGKHQQLRIYADSNNIYEALAGAYFLALDELGNPAIRSSISEVI